MILTVVISTLGEGVNKLERALGYRHQSVRYLIVHQGGLEHPLPGFVIGRSDVEVLSSSTRGLSVSRNVGLAHCSTPYALIADDDIELIPEGMERLLNILQEERPDFALFQIQTGEGEPAYKDYPTEEYVVKKLKHWVSSIEIVVNTKKLKHEGIRFDERFGLGTVLDRGEEEIFVTDLIRAGWAGRYYPITIVRHPYESSGKHPRDQKDRYFFQGAFDARMGNVFPHSQRFSYWRNPKKLVPAIFYRRGMRYIRHTDGTINRSDRPRVEK